MKYLCLVYLDEANWSACPDRDCFDFATELAQAGRLVAAEPLHPAHMATTVRLRNGRASFTDGPFSETKELLAGFYLIEAKDLNEGLAIATSLPPQNTAASRCARCERSMCRVSARSRPKPSLRIRRDGHTSPGAPHD